jgi:hypothetical protein
VVQQQEPTAGAQDWYICAMAARSSGMLHRARVHTTVSKDPSAKGSASALASRNATARLRPAARLRATASIAGLRSTPVRATSAG